MWRLIGDIGGTNARFALIRDGSTAPERELTLSCNQHMDLAAAVKAYYQQADVVEKPKFAAIALATALSGDHVEFTNSNWSFSASETQSVLDLTKLELLNDFTALALSLPHLKENDLVRIGGGEAVMDAPIALIGAGTGLGVSGLIPMGQSWHPLSTEGGHCSIATRTEREHAVVAEISKSFPHVSSERLLSGPGILCIYKALCAIENAPAVFSSPAEITDKATSQSCPLCVESISLFCELLGTAAGNLTISLGARGGTFIGGGIAPKLGATFLESNFRARFDDKGRFSDYMKSIPVSLIIHPNPAVVGLAAEVNSLI